MARTLGSKNKPKGIPPGIDDSAAVKDTESFREWDKRLVLARKLRTDWETQYDIVRLENIFLGHRPTGTRERDLNLNHFRATVRAMRPNLIMHNPTFIVRPKPRRGGSNEQLEALKGEGMLRAIAEQDNGFLDALRLALSQGFFRYAVVKAVYDPRMEENPRKGQPLFEMQNGQKVVDEQTGEFVPLVDPLTGKDQVEPDQIMSDESYRWEWVDCKHLLLPDEGPDQHKWTWIAEEITVLLEDAKQDSRFPSDLREQLESNVSRGKPEKKGRRSSGEQETDPLLAYTEIYQNKKKRFVVVCEGQTFTGLLLDTTLPDGVEDNPYAILNLGDAIQAPEPNPWPIPLTRDWLSPHLSYNRNRKQVDGGSRRAARKVLYTEETFPDADSATGALESPDDMQGVKINNQNNPPKILETPPLSVDIYRSMEISRTDWLIITGQPGARSGDPEKETATEATFVERAANVRDLDIQSLVNTWMGIAGKKMLQLVKQTLTLDYWIKLRGFSDKELQLHLERQFKIPPGMLREAAQQFPQLTQVIRESFGREKPLAITREELTFEADVSVVPGSSRPPNLQVETQEALGFLRLLGQFPGALTEPELVQWIAAKFESINDRIIQAILRAANKQVEIAANQAGRNQGGAAPDTGQGQGSTAGKPKLSSLVR